jgi:two-component system, OmpR family, response regulator CpxR
MMRKQLQRSNAIFQPANQKKFPRSRASRRYCGIGEEMRPKKTILCADDNEQALSIRKVMLETRGYRVLTCTNGQQALEIFKKGGVDLLLSDLVMPGGLDGADLVKRVKEISPETPAILFSGKIRVYDHDTRADVFLPKGMYAPVELLERIRILLIKKRGPKRATPKAEPLPVAI